MELAILSQYPGSPQLSKPLLEDLKKWLFSDTSRGVKASATRYGLIETARANGLAPYKYLHNVQQHIAAAKTVEDVEALLPCNMK